jgi:rhodanese-related sulfurtransferase
MKLLVVLLILGVSFAQTIYTTVSVQDLATSEEPRFILDVRQPDEYAAGHVAESVLIPLDQLQSRASEVPDDLPLYVICRSGNRSRQASKILIDLGFSDVRNVEGGVLAWQEAGYELQQE